MCVYLCVCVLSGGYFVLHTRIVVICVGGCNKISCALAGVVEDT